MNGRRCRPHRMVTCLIAALAVGAACARDARDCAPLMVGDGCQSAFPHVEHDILELDEPEIVKRHDYDEWQVSDACNCAYIPCMERAQCPPIQRSRHWEVEVSVELGGEVSGEVRQGLLAALFVDLGVELTVSLQTGLRWTLGSTTTWTLPRSDCFRMKYRTGYTTTQTSRSYRTIKTRCTFLEHCKGQPPIERITTSGVRESIARATAKSGFSDQIAPYPASCGGPIFLPGQDLYAGGRAEPCAPNLCPRPQSPQQPGCGCWQPS